MTGKVIIAGSTAIDQTGIYGGDFASYQASYPISALNMSFQLTDMKVSFGGCAANIAWGLSQLGVCALPLSSAGRSFRDRYAKHLTDIGIDIQYIAVDETTDSCATCLMINDQTGNQIIGFYPGPHAPDRRRPGEMPDIGDVELAILGPEAPALSLAQARDLASLSIPFVFDPGQVISDYRREEIRELIQLCRYLIINDYEFSVLQTNAGLSADEVFSQVDEVVITRSADGVDIHHDQVHTHVDAIAAVDIVDVTGCGDAFRAGYSLGILEGVSAAQCAEYGCTMAMLNLQAEHTQTYRTSLDEMKSLHRKHYGS